MKIEFKDIQGFPLYVLEDLKSRFSGLFCRKTIEEQAKLPETTVFKNALPKRIWPLPAQTCNVKMHGSVRTLPFMDLLYMGEGPGLTEGNVNAECLLNDIRIIILNSKGHCLSKR